MGEIVNDRDMRGGMDRHEKWFTVAWVSRVYCHGLDRGYLILVDLWINAVAGSLCPGRDSAPTRTLAQSTILQKAWLLLEYIGSMDAKRLVLLDSWLNLTKIDMKDCSQTTAYTGKTVSRSHHCNRYYTNGNSSSSFLLVAYGSRIHWPVESCRSDGK